MTALPLACDTTPPRTASGEIDLADSEGRRAEIPAPLGLCLDEPGSCGLARDGGVTARPPATAETVWRVPVNESAPQRGPRDALVTVVVFSDFECPFCARMAAVLRDVAPPGREAERDLRVVWKDLPLPQHPHAERAALFARAVRERQGDAGFWRAHDAIFDAQPELGDGALRAIAKRLDLDFAALATDIAARRHARALLDDIALADRTDIRRTPTLFVNGRKVEGLVAPQALESLVDRERDEAARRVAQGIGRAALYARIIEGGREIVPVTD